MGITDFNEKKGSGVRSASKNERRQRTYNRVFIVETDDASIGPATIFADGRLPAIGAMYDNGTEQDRGAFCSGLDVAEVSDDGLQWEVTAKYGPYDLSEFPDDPTTWKIVIQYGSTKYERVLTEDQDGNAVINSAYQPFADPVTVDDTRSLITITRRELVSGFDPTLAANYKDTINSGSWNNFSPYCVKCDDITTSEPQYDSTNQRWFYVVTYVFSINERETWRLSVLDQGFAELVGGQLKPVLINGQPPSDPVLLDGSGTRTTDPHFLTFKGFAEVDFGTFNIDFAQALGM